MTTDIIEYISRYINFPPEFQFILYLAAASILLVFIVVILDLFASIFLSFFGHR